jgi:hypothetical protein
MFRQNSFGIDHFLIKFTWKSLFALSNVSVNLRNNNAKTVNHRAEKAAVLDSGQKVDTLAADKK